MANAWRIAQEMGIELVSKRNFRTGDLAPRQTRSRAAIKEIAEAGQALGYPEMVYDVLGLFLASPVNERQLYGECLHGVARWLQSARLRTEDIPFIRPAFTEIDMGFVRNAVQHYRIPNRVPQVAFMVAGLMEPALEQIDVNRGRKQA